MKIEVSNGDVFNLLTVIKEEPRKRLPSGQTNRVFLCRCECGKDKSVRLSHLRHGKIKSCGCSRTGRSEPTTNEIYIRKIWRAIKYRTQSNYSFSSIYYDKGVRVCDEWLNDYLSFESWAKKHNLRKGLQIDRINGDGDYCPENCRVVTPIVNCNNRYNTYFVCYNGVSRPITILLRELGLFDKYNTIRGRILRGWPIEKAIDTPIKKGNYNRT